MKNWKTVKLGELLTESRIVSEKPDANKRLTVRLHTQGIEKRPFTKGKKGATKYFVRSAGQFIYGRQNLHKGAFGIIPEEFDGYESSADIPAFDVDKSCLPEWIFYFFKKNNFYLKLESIAKGVGSKRINPNQIFDLDILVPPIEEQRLLLDKVTKLTSKLEKAKNEFEKQLKYLNLLQQSILDDAITGKLSKEWREKNDKSFKDKIKSPDIIPEFWKDKVKLPISWKWKALKQIVDKENKISYGVLSPGKDISDGVPLIRVSDLRNSETGILPDKRISIDIDKKYKRTKIKGGEILITVVGSDIGMSVIAHNNWIGANIARAVARVLFDVKNNTIDSKFILYCIQSQKVQVFFKDSSKSIGQPTLNINTIENLVLPLPPIREQKVIVQQVKQLKEHCNNLKEEAIYNLYNVENAVTSMIIELLGKDLNTFQVVQKVKEEAQKKRNIKFDSKTTLMDIVELLQEHGKLHAEDLWKMSKFPEDIDAFYAELKHQIEDEKSIKEVESEKGYLELA